MFCSNHFYNTLHKMNISLFYKKARYFVSFYCTPIHFTDVSERNPTRSTV